MNKLHDRRGKFASRKRLISLWAVSIIFVAGTLALAVVGGQQVYLTASQRVKDLFSPKVEVAVAETPEPSDMKEWVLWRVSKEGINPYEAYMIIQKESQWDDQNTGINTGAIPSVDMGLWQLNTTRFHSKKTKHYISPTCAYEYKCATEEAIKIYKDWGNSWGAWTTAKDLGLK